MRPHEARRVPARLTRDWTVAFVVGEMVGFVPPAVVGAALAATGAGDPVLVVGLTAAGTFEGVALGVAQARVLRRYETGVDGRRWIVATAGAAAFAWFVGMGGGALMGAAQSPLLLLLLVPAWTVALLGMGWAQWRVLRRVVPESRRWVPVTAGAWILGVMIPVAAMSLAPDDLAGVLRAGLALVAAVLMGLVVGSLTARTLRRLLTSPGSGRGEAVETRSRGAAPL